MRAILSVYDKTGVVDFARGLEELGFELFSTGGTESLLREAGVKVRGVQELTGFPEMLGGRVKTLHPAVHGGILALRDDPSHLEELARHGLEPVDIVVANLYPFLKVARETGARLVDALENIDIGGHTLLRAAAKNFASVAAGVRSRTTTTRCSRSCGAPEGVSPGHAPPSGRQGVPALRDLRHARGHAICARTTRSSRASTRSR